MGYAWELKSSESAEIDCLRLEGELTFQDVPDLYAFVHQKPTWTASVTIDLTGVQSLDMAVWQCLWLLCQNLNQSQVKETLVLTENLDHHLRFTGLEFQHKEVSHG